MNILKGLGRILNRGMEQFYITLINGEVIKPSHDVHFLCCHKDYGYSHQYCKIFHEFFEYMRNGNYPTVMLSRKFGDREGKYIFRVIPKQNILSYNKIEEGIINLIKQNKKICQFTEQ